MSGLQDLAEQLQTAAGTLQLTRRCANGCGTTLPPGTAAGAYAMCPRCVLLTSGKLFDCRPCGREWTAKQEAHCAGCHRHFSSDSAFDAHISVDQAGSVHHDPATLRKRDGSPRLVPVQSEHGVTWSGPGMTPEAIAKLRSRS